MFAKISNFWNENSFIIIVCLSIVFIFVLSLSQKIKKNKGTWKDNFKYIKAGKENLPLTISQKNDSLGEKICRQTLEKIFKKPFQKIRPDWLNNSITGLNLELDCFNPELRLACEYNGKQHYDFIPHFHRNKEAFLNQKYRDYMKKNLCKENGVFLIEIPYTIKPQDIEYYIKGKLIQLGYSI